MEPQGGLRLDPEHLQLGLLAKMDPRFTIWKDVAGAASGYFTCGAAEVAGVLEAGEIDAELVSEAAGAV